MTSLRISNGIAMPLTVWVEPWCDELILPSRSEMSLSPQSDGGHDIMPAVEAIDDRLVVWATAPGTLNIAIDGVVQDTGSRTIVLPAELFDMPVKDFVGIVFGEHPATRPGGAPNPFRRSIGTRLIGLWSSAKLLAPSWIGFD
jgi:hypothetical protein